MVIIGPIRQLQCVTAGLCLSLVLRECTALQNQTGKKWGIAPGRNKSFGKSLGNMFLPPFGTLITIYYGYTYQNDAHSETCRSFVRGCERSLVIPTNQPPNGLNVTSKVEPSLVRPDKATRRLPFSCSFVLSSRQQSKEYWQDR